MQSDSTFLGLIDGVIGARVSVSISHENLPSANPIIDGRIYRLGQIGTFVKIPLGFLTLFGMVTKVGASKRIEEEDEEAVFAGVRGERWLEVQLLGEAVGNERFQRGLSVFPTLDDEVHIVTEMDLQLIYGSSAPTSIPIGKLASSDALYARVDLDKLVSRHAAIVGSTGSGKSNTVASLLRVLGDGSFPSARILVIDPHGEYASALKDCAQVFSIGSKVSPLIVPYWALSFDELAWFLVDRKSSAESMQDGMLREKLVELRKACCATLKAGSIDVEEVTGDSPIPFSLKQLWYDFDRKERVTYQNSERTLEALEEEGDAAGLKPAKFKPHSTTNTAPYKPAIGQQMGGYVHKIITKLKDRRFKFLLDVGAYDGVQADLDDLVKGWMSHDKPITVLDLGGVPFEVTDLVVGTITRIIFECMFWGRDLSDLGKNRPILLVFEEAHGYLPKGGSSQFVPGYASRAVRRVFKEGRKYGVGGVVISQRPAELDETILSQCGTFFALRLTNSEDQGRVRATLPDSVGDLAALLPALRTGEAIVVGEGVQVPSRVHIPLVEPRPASDDAKTFDKWKIRKSNKTGLGEAVTSWRKQRAKS